MNRHVPNPAYVPPADRDGRALEVTALLGDSVVGVSYVQPARGRRHPRADRFTIGRAPDADFATDRAPAERFELIAPTEAGPRVRLLPGMRAELTAGGERVELEDGTHEIDLPPGSRLLIEDGPVRFAIGWVAAPRAQALGQGASFERRVAAFVAVSAAAHLAFLGMVHAIPPDASRLSLDPGARDGRLASTKFTPREDPKKEESDPGGSRAPGELTEKREPKARGRKGTVGEPEATRTEGRAAVRERADEPQLARHQAIERARRSGILGKFRSDRQLFTSLTSQNPFASGSDAEDVRGGRYGPEVAAVRGPFSSTWGNAPHDLSDHPYYQEGLIEAGELPSGGWDDSGFGHGPDGPGSDLQRTAKTPERVEIGPPETTGERDGEIIRRHIRRKLRRVRHCYQKALVGAPDLEGTATVQFTITTEGRVLGARAGGMGNEGLHTCVADVISTIQFPRSPNGTAANVRYPFHLRHAGSR